MLIEKQTSGSKHLHCRLIHITWPYYMSFGVQFSLQTLSVHFFPPRSPKERIKLIFHKHHLFGVIIRFRICSIAGRLSVRIRIARNYNQTGYMVWLIKYNNIIYSIMFKKHKTWSLERQKILFHLIILKMTVNVLSLCCIGVRYFNSGLHLLKGSRCHLYCRSSCLVSLISWMI